MKEIESKYYARLLRRVLQQGAWEGEVRVAHGSILVYPPKETFYTFGRAGELVYAFARVFNFVALTMSETCDNEIGCRPYISIG